MDSNKMTADNKFVVVASSIAKYSVYTVCFSILNVYSIFALLFISILITRYYFSNNHTFLESIKKSFVWRNIWRSILGGLIIFILVYYLQSSIYNSLFINNIAIFYISIIVLVYVVFLLYSGTIIYSTKLLENEEVGFIKSLSLIPSNIKYLLVTFCVCISLFFALFYIFGGYAILMYYCLPIIEIKLFNLYKKGLENA